MKKLLALMCFFVLLLLFVPSNSVFASASEITTYTWVEAEYTKIIKNDDELRFYDRTAGTDAEKEFALFLQQEMIALGYTPAGSDETNPSFDYFVFNSSVDGLSHYSQNVKFVKNGSVGDKKVVICTSYDNAYGFADEENNMKIIGEDASLSNVLCALAIARELAIISYDFDIEFVFFGAEYHDFAGGKEYALAINEKEANNILVAINIDDLSSGSLFYYDAEKSTKYGSYFGNYIKQNTNVKISKYIAGNSVILSNNSIYPFTHRALMSDNTALIESGVRVISLLTVNKNGVFGNEYYSVSDSKTFTGENIPTSLQTSADVADAVASFVSNGDFEKYAVGNGKLASFLTNENIALIFVLVAIVLLWIVYFVVYKLLIKKLRQKYTPKEVEVEISAMVDKEIAKSNNIDVLANKQQIHDMFSETIKKRLGEDDDSDDEKE